MTLNKPSGNMYAWCWTFNPFGGQCGLCDWCYVKTKFQWLYKYQGRVGFAYGQDGKPLPSLKKNDDLLELSPQIAKLKPLPIFVQAMGEIYHPHVKRDDRRLIYAHCRRFDNPYLIVTKFPNRIEEDLKWLPWKTIVGTTIETNKGKLVQKYSRAPIPYTRFYALSTLKWGLKMVSIEPILTFDVRTLAGWIELIHPEFVAIGANSYRKLQLPEPKKETVVEFVNKILHVTEVRLKKNLNYLGFHFEDDQILPRGAKFP